MMGISTAEGGPEAQLCCNWECNATGSRAHPAGQRTRRRNGAGREVDRMGMSTAEGGPEAQSSAPGRAADPAEKRSRKGGRHDGNVHGRGRARGSSTKGEYCKEVNTAKSRKYGLDANGLGMKPGSDWL
ncbi:hypothetical protein B0H12DRAFT_1073726, partial [Mycena haematopus]